MPAQNDYKVDDEEALHRRVLHRLSNFLVFDKNLGRWTPGNAALRFDPDLSVYLNGEMDRLGLSVADILDHPEAAVVFAVRAGSVRSESFGVEATPSMPVLMPLDSAHGSVWPDPEWDKDEFRKRRNSIRRRFEHVAGEITFLASDADR